jgi:hypothetical protein
MDGEPAVARRRGRAGSLLVVLTLALVRGGNSVAQERELSPAVTANLAQLALACIEREYPNKIAHVLASDEDVHPPRALTPVFYGCFDWHSAVHGHWMLVRLIRSFPSAVFATEARAALARNLQPERVAAEVRYLEAEGRGTFERPYGLAWLLQLSAELHEWDDVQGRAWRTALAPLEALAADRFRTWFPKLSHPIRTGEHSQTAFAMGLIHDWAVTTGDAPMRELVEARARDYYLGDHDAPLHFEPGGQDFLSPCLAEADLLRRVLPADEFGAWLTTFLPALTSGGFDLPPAVVTDPTDGKLAHLDGLNLSRAWMLDGIHAALSAEDPRREVLEELIEAHRRSGLASVTGAHYEGGHWLGSFAVYLVTRRGIRD